MVSSKRNCFLPVVFGIMLAAKQNLGKSWALRHGEQGSVWPLLSCQSVLLSNYTGVVGQGARGSAGMSRAGGREGRTAVGEVPLGACAVRRVVGELPLHPAALAVGLV